MLLFASGPEDELVSGSTDGTAIVWQRTGMKVAWQQYAVLTGHTNAVNAVCSMCVPNSKGTERTLVVTASADSTVKIWERSKKGGKLDITVTCLRFVYADQHNSRAYFA